MAVFPSRKEDSHEMVEEKWTVLVPANSENEYNVASMVGQIDYRRPSIGSTSILGSTES